MRTATDLIKTVSAASDRERLLRVLQECHGKLGGADGAAARLTILESSRQSFEGRVQYCAPGTERIAS